MHTRRPLAGAALAAPFAALLTLGCDLTVAEQSGEPTYARMEGTITRRDGSPYRDGTVFGICAGQFGFTNGRTDAAGVYRVTVVAPGALQQSIAAGGSKAMCVLSAPSTATPFARDSALATFAASPDAAPVTRLDLREP